MNWMKGRGSLTGSGGDDVRRGLGDAPAAGVASVPAAATGSGRSGSLRTARTGSRRRGRGGGDVGTGGGPLADRTLLDLRLPPEDESRLRRSAARDDIRLLGPRTGVRSVKIQPTSGTGLPPMRRPSSKSQSYSPWNSWNESLEKTVAPARSAISSRNLSPLPIVPAGGVTSSLAASASS